MLSADVLQEVFDKYEEDPNLMAEDWLALARISSQSIWCLAYVQR